MPVPVRDSPFCKQPVAFSEVFNYNRVCFPYILACVFSSFLSIRTVWTYRAENRKFIFHANVKVVYTMPWGDMYTACVFCSYEVGKINAMLYLVLHRYQVPNRAFVLKFCKLFPEHCFKHFVVNVPALSKDIFDQVCGCNEDFFRAVLPDCSEFRVFKIRMHGNSHVCWNCPGGCCPDNYEGIFLAFDLKFHIDRRVGPIRIFDLGVCNCSLTTRAPID